VTLNCLGLDLPGLATTFLGVLFGVPAGMFLYRWKERKERKKYIEKIDRQRNQLLETIRDAIEYNQSRLEFISSQALSVKQNWKGKEPEIIEGDVDFRFLAASSGKRYDLIENIRLNYSIDSLVRQLEEFQIFIRDYRSQYYSWIRYKPEWNTIGFNLIVRMAQESKSIREQIESEITPEVLKALESC